MPLPVLTVFAHSPDGGRGLARDMRARWALAELDVDYDVRGVSFEQMAQGPHLARQPFGQIPVWEDGELVLFESGAIVLHLAERHPGLLPADPVARARARGWIIAALSTVEPPIVEREAAGYAEADRDWYATRLALLEERIERRLAQLAAWLGEDDWLDGDFSAGDLMMIEVLGRLRGEALLDRHPTLAAYVARGRARPAYRRAFAAQKAWFEAHAAP